MGNAGYGNHTEDTKDSVDPKRPDSRTGTAPSNTPQPDGAPKGTEEPGRQKAGAPEPSDRLPPAGPHADPRLMNPDSTPDTGALTPAGQHDDVDSTSS
jgi:hypothetical protein